MLGITTWSGAGLTWIVRMPPTGTAFFSMCQPAEAMRSPNTYYGESIIPPAYVKRAWSRSFECHEFIDTPSISQALFILQRRASAVRMAA